MNNQWRTAVVIFVIFSVMIVATIQDGSVTNPERTNECCKWTDYGFHAPSDYQWQVNVNASCQEVYLDDCQRSVTDTVCVPIDGKVWNESKSGECNPTLMSVMDVFEYPPTLFEVLFFLMVIFIILGLVIKHPEWF